MSYVISAELPPEPPELRESRFWNQWVAIGKRGILGANPKLTGLFDDLDAAGVGDDEAVTTLFNTPPSDSILIPTQFFEE